ncbi:TonB family protein [Candidatus Fermentibacteria bacterium]|nr:TonB family protein [Candidatus Fermentibacteria bacterium]
MPAEAMVFRKDSFWSSGVIVSLLAHVVVLVSLNQLPTARVRLQPRELIMEVDLMEPPPTPEPPPESPPQERGELAQPPQPNLLDMSAAALPEPGQDLFRDLPVPDLDLSYESPLDLQQPTLDLTERDVLRSDAKQSALSLDGEFLPTLPGDRLDVGGRRDAMVVGEASRDGLAPAPVGPGHTPRTVGYPTARPTERTSGLESSPVRPAGASRSLGVPDKPTVGAPGEVMPGSRTRKRLRLVEPTVPAWVEDQGIEAYAKVRFQILEDGRIGTIELTMSSGYRELDNLAIGAVKQWLYEPGLVEYRSVRVNFKLR